MTKYTRSRHSRGARSRALAGCVVAISTLVAACGSDDDSSAATSTEQAADTTVAAATTVAAGSDTTVAAATTVGAGSDTTAAAGNDCVAAANDYLTAWDELPTALPAEYTPLAAKPAPGKVIKLVNGTIPSDGNSAEEQKKAAEAIGWEFESIVFNGTAEDLNAKAEQAITEKPTVITNAGWPVAAWSKPIEDAKAAGIVISLSSITNEAADFPGHAATSNASSTAVSIGELNAYKVMADSGCSANVAIFSLPFPILTVATDAFQATLADKCPDCKTSYIELQAKDLGTPAVTNAIVSTLQADPSIGYAYAIIGNVAAGLAPALDAANIKNIKIFGQVPDENAIKALREGTNAWWVNQSALVNGWTELDAALRAIEAGSAFIAPTHPLALLTPDNVPQDGGLPVNPEDFREEFTALWNP
jgi:hypothetical protein